MLLENEQERRKIGQIAAQYVADRTGATKKIMDYANTMLLR
jgi:hypothetical protein